MLKKQVLNTNPIDNTVVAAVTMFQHAFAFRNYLFFIFILLVILVVGEEAFHRRGRWVSDVLDSKFGYSKYLFYIF